MRGNKGGRKSAEGVERGVATMDRKEREAGAERGETKMHGEQ